MADLIREAGWGIYPVFIFGGVCLVLALLHALAPAVTRLPLLYGSAALTVISGVLGTAVGVHKSARHIGDVPDGERWIFLIGLAESLGCVIVALVLLALAGLLVTAGSYRRARWEAALPPNG